MSASAWTEERIGRLKSLWKEGRTAEQIARDLQNGITRSAVLGKVHRLGLGAGRSGRPARESHPARGGSAGPGAKLLRPQRVVEEGGAPPAGAVTLLAVERDRCRWPYGDPAGPAFRLCGQPVARGAYCGPHSEIAYRPATETARTLERLARLN